MLKLQVVSIRCFPFLFCSFLYSKGMFQMGLTSLPSPPSISNALPFILHTLLLPLTHIGFPNWCFLILLHLQIVPLSKYYIFFLQWNYFWKVWRHNEKAPSCGNILHCTKTSKQEREKHLMETTLHHILHGLFKLFISFNKWTI